LEKREGRRGLEEREEAKMYLILWLGEII